MNQLELNNIIAQNKLMKDIINNHQMIIFCLQEDLKKVSDQIMMGAQKKDQTVPNPLVSYNHEQIDIIQSVLHKALNHFEPGVARAIKDNETKFEILGTLTK